MARFRFYCGKVRHAERHCYSRITDAKVGKVVEDQYGEWLCAVPYRGGLKGSRSRQTDDDDSGGGLLTRDRNKLRDLRGGEGQEMPDSTPNPVVEGEEGPLGEVVLSNKRGGYRVVSMMT